MGIDDGSIATTALVIAIAALITAFSQLLQQLFVTADGLRKCQNSVIGGWSQLVQLKFRWSTLRFEVRVVTPHFVIAPPGVLTTSVRKLNRSPTLLQKLLWKRSSFWCDASKPVGIVDTIESRRWTSVDTIGTDFTEEPVTWLSLIEDVHELQGMQFGRPVPDLASLLSFRRHTRSWDFMPAEIVRPIASTTIGCLVSIVHRMGLTWVDFRPDEGIIRATARGRSISAARVRGLGLVVEYISNGTSLTLDLDQRIPSQMADKMACGILPTFRETENLSILGLDIPLRDQRKPLKAQLSQAFRTLDLDDSAIETLHQSLAHNTASHALPGFADLLGLWSDWMPISGHESNVVENPFPIEVTSMGRRPEPRVVWRYLLQQRLNKSPQIQRVLEIYNEWECLDPTRFASLYEACADSFDFRTTMIPFFKDVFEETQSYFNCYDPWFYVELVKLHVSVNTQSLKQAEENICAGLDRPQAQVPWPRSLYPLEPIFRERAFVYVENISRIVGALDSENWIRATQIPPIEEAWWMMMLRMQAWNMSVKLTMRAGMTVPHYYYGDPSRVYIL